MLAKLQKMSVGIRVTVVVVFMVATALTAGLAIGLQYYFGRAMASEAATELYATASSGIATKWRTVGEQNVMAIDLLAENPTLADRTKTDSHLELLANLMRRNPLYYGVYIGHEDGSFYELINVNTSNAARRAFRATPTDQWVLISIDGTAENRERRFEYMDDSFKVRVIRSEPTDFDVSSRPWYRGALEADSSYRSEPYLFAQLGLPGRTVAKQISGTQSVIGIDMTLDTVSKFLQEQDISRKGEVFIYRPDGQIIASSRAPDTQNNLPVPALNLTVEEIEYLKTLPELVVSNELDWPPFDFAIVGQPQGYSIDVMRLIGAMLDIDLRFVNGYTWSELVARFQAGEIDLLHSVLLNDTNAQWGIPSDSYATLPYAFVTLADKPDISSMSELVGRRVAIPEGWSVIKVINERYPDVEIVEAKSTHNAIELVLDGTVDAAFDNEVILRYIERHYFISGLKYDINIDMGQGDLPNKLHVLSSDRYEQLSPILNRAIAALGKAQRDYLESQWLAFSDDDAEPKSTGAVPLDILMEATEDPALHRTMLEVDYDGQPHYVYAEPLNDEVQGGMYLGMLVPAKAVVDPFMDKVKLSSMITAAFLFLLMPLSWAFATPIVRPVKQLAMENEKIRRRDYDDVEKITSHVTEIHQLSSSMVKMVEAIKAHEQAQRDLMDAFIKLIAQAIDDKSPYTGGHCERVPELALMLAEKASATDAGVFSQFKLEGEDQWREYRIAAWLHDCGKITTPEHIVDKGSKLETIYNRFHEVRMRFEALWRDAEIDFLKELREHPEREAELAEELKRQQARLQDDFAFVADCNVGGEFLDPEKQERLRSIAQLQWQRNFDNRAGLSPVEELAVGPSEPKALPVTENLLQDRPEHIIPRTRSTDYPPEFGINMDIPEHLYNQGEVYNLSISRGTLTAEDRFKINEHMISTIKMLESLPLPEELKNVPRYASTHHETMRGSGYPRKLPGEQLSIPERILAVADVFEALTASDRPYKKAKPISVAIDILHKMVEDDHIDRDCFELFVREKVYLAYANQFLDPSQIDDVDESKYLQVA